MLILRMFHVQHFAKCGGETRQKMPYLSTGRFRIHEGSGGFERAPWNEGSIPQEAGVEGWRRAAYVRRMGELIVVVGYAGFLVALYFAISRDLIQPILAWIWIGMAVSALVPLFGFFN